MEILELQNLEEDPPGQWPCPVSWSADDEEET